MNANPILLQKKYSRVIECFAREQGISLGCGIGLFLPFTGLSADPGGISDMHCMSDAYLAEELEQEYQRKD